MAINLLKRGESVELTKGNDSLRNITIGLKWGGKSSKSSKRKGGLLSAIFGGGDDNESVSNSSSVDVDSAVILVDSKGNKSDRIYYGKRNGQGINHAGDDRTGNSQYGKEDNEEIYIKLNQLSTSVEELYVVANIFSGASDFSKVKGSYMRLINSDNGEELIRYELEDFKGMGGVVIGKLYKRNNEWKFKAVGEGIKTNRIESIENTILRG